MHEIETTEPVSFQCRHIFTDGRRCASPTLRSPAGHEPFCYYHHTTRGATSMTKDSGVPHSRGASSRVGGGRRSTFTLPLPEDRSSIQHSIGEVLRRIASNEIDSRRAGLLLYGLQIASLNLKKDHKTGERCHRNTEEFSPEETVTEVTHDPAHGLLAPPAELHANQPIGSAQRLLMELGNPDDERDVVQPSERSEPELPEPALTDAPTNFTIDLQATAMQSHGTAWRSRNFIPQSEHHRCSPCGLPRMAKPPRTMCGKSAAKKQKAHLSVGFSK